jgi:PqqD family protein of HPr-rel-A system
MASVGTDRPAHSVSDESRRSEKWRVAGDGPLRWRAWAAEYEVYNPLSGQTHLLDVLAGQTLKLIMSGTASISDLRSEASRFLEVPQDDHLVQVVDDLLHRLEAGGLIEPVR